VLLLRFAGTSQSVAHQGELATAILKEQGMLSAGSVADDDAVVWQRLAAFPVRWPGDLIWRAGTSPSGLAEFLTQLESGLRWQAQLGLGTLRVFDDTRQETDRNFVGAPLRGLPHNPEGLEQLRAQARTMGGWLVLENAPPEVKQRTDTWGGFGAATDLMKRVKHELDPDGTLSPGHLGL
jgi:hypothetical protein